jgi:hypothetical protein
MDQKYTDQDSPDEGHPAGRRRLPAPADDTWQAYDSGTRHGSARRDAGVRTTRRASNWTAAALIAGVAATSGYFVHGAATPAGSPGTATHLIQQPGAATGHGQHPSLSHPVATSGGSGVTGGSSVTGGSGGTGGSGATHWVDN